MPLDLGSSTFAQSPVPDSCNSAGTGSGMGIGTSMALMVVGAILAFAVEVDTSVLDVQAAGVILLLTGLLGLGLSVLYWDSRWGGWSPSSTRGSRDDVDERW